MLFRSLDQIRMVKLFGISTHPRLRMVLELVPCGDLFDFLHPKGPSGERGQISRFHLRWELRLRLAFDIARGMLYLQSFNPPIVHRDLRSPNIFLSSLNPQSDVCAKVADFGLSRMVAPDLGGALGTWQWLAPEVFNASGNDRYDERADCFSFAIVCWELASREFPYSEFERNPKYSSIQPDGSWQVNLFSLKQAISDGLRPSFPPENEKVPPAFEALIKRCWDGNPKKRPAFPEIVAEIRTMIDSAYLPPLQQMGINTLPILQYGLRRLGGLVRFFGKKDV